jgi:hypothetical protein
VPEEKSELVESRAVTMYPSDWATVDSHAKDMGLNTSSSLRFIIREWRQFKGAQLGFQLDCEPATR